MQTVSTLSIEFMILTLVIALILPVALTIVLCVKRKIHIIPVLVGAGVFFVFQLVLRSPALQLAALFSPSFKQFVGTPIMGGLFLGLTAGIFEEFGRYIGYRVALKKHTAWQDGLAFGIGHGGIEAIALVGLGSVNNLLFSVAINTGRWDSIATVLPAVTAQQTYDALVQTPAYLFALGGIERLFAMTIQVAFSILVLYAIRKRDFQFVLLAVLLHLVVDAPVNLVKQQFGYIATELFVMLCAAAALVYIIRSRKVFARLEGGQPVQPQSSEDHPIT
ncbi:MAG: YhfC family intramembrane metalloprotease [Acetanaerobacterium sp.]